MPARKLNPERLVRETREMLERMNADNPVDLKKVNFEWNAYRENFLRGEPHTVANAEQNRAVLTKWIRSTTASIDAPRMHKKILAVTFQKAFGNPPILKASHVGDSIAMNISDGDLREFMKKTGGADEANGLLTKYQMAHVRLFGHVDRTPVGTVGPVSHNIWHSVYALDTMVSSLIMRVHKLG
ncbi:MAG: hypothetical protein V1787_03495 [Candidatus Micrarchaeota archaeon]